MVPDVLYYNRKNDEDLTTEDVKSLIESRTVTRDQMIAWFTAELDEALEGNFDIPEA